MRRLGGYAALAALLMLGACEADRPVFTSIARGTEASACARNSQIDKAEFAFTNRDHAITAMLCWIERNSTYTNLPPPQHWVEVTDAHMQSLGQRATTRGGDTAALYNCRAAALYFKKGFDARKLSEQSMLVHELTHHAQCVNQKLANSAANVCANETEAYAMQAKFIRSAAAQRDDEEKRKIIEAAGKLEGTMEEFCKRVRR
jgi:hypothetical protein